ncbi:MAG: 50S ribosomal protein L9 [Alphaproteobacteria bacterium]
MDVILLERVEKLGIIGDVVTVKPGFARNYLLPQRKALRATKANMAEFEARRVQLEADNLKAKEEASSVAKRLDGQGFILVRQASDTGILYGSVATRDIADVVTEGGFTITRSQVVLDRSIKTLGLQELQIKLHPEVSVTVKVAAAKSKEEGEAYLRGELVMTSAEAAQAEADEAKVEAEALAAEIAAEVAAEEAAAAEA